MHARTRMHTHAHTRTHTHAHPPPLPHTHTLSYSPWCKEFNKPHVFTLNHQFLKVSVRQFNHILGTTSPSSPSSSTSSTSSTPAFTTLKNVHTVESLQSGLYNFVELSISNPVTTHPTALAT